MTEVRRPRGRPRPDETIERDEVVLKTLREQGPKTRNELADMLGMDDQLPKVYLSLNRLRQQRLVCTCAPRAGSDMLWMAVEEDKPCP